MPTLAETRLAAYVAAEVEILKAQEVRGAEGRGHRMAELRDVQKQITSLRAQVAREQQRAAGGDRLGGSVVNLSGEC